MFLRDNVYLQRDLVINDIKRYVSGHWGTSPGINFLYAHLNRYITEYRRKTQLVIGSGHAAKALLSNLYLEGTLCEYYPALNEKYERLLNFIHMGKIAPGMRSEINPFYPGVIYDGGELGYSLPVAFGSVLDYPDLLTVCIIGDGEAETGTISASWNCKELMNTLSGFVLPIIHLNKYRMGDRSLLSYKSDEDLQSLFKGMGYLPKVITTNHTEMIEALNWVDRTHREIQGGKHNKWPILIFRSPKGWTAPENDIFKIEGTLRSHKNPLHDLYENHSAREYLKHWLMSYCPEELFERNGDPDSDILKIIPDEKYRLGNALKRYKRKQLYLPDIKNFALHQEAGDGFRNITVLLDYFSEILQQNSGTFRIMSPDELESNLLGGLREITTANYSDKAIAGSDNSGVMEILNENICQAWMQGYLMTGRNCVMISYEAFMPIITSMTSQYAKWLFQAEKIPWRKKTASLTYLLTSLCWSNTYSHQNPEFINNLLGHQHSYVRIYLPPDANSLLACMQLCLSSEGRINAIIVSKQVMPQWFDIETALSGLKQGVINWDWLDIENHQTPDIIFAAAGDFSIRETLAGIDEIRKYVPGLKVRFLSVVELTSIGPVSVYSHAMEMAEFSEFFLEDIPILFCFHGYASVIKMLLFDRITHQRLKVLGYNNQSITSANSLNKMILNGNSRYHIALEAVNMLYNDKRITKDQYDVVQKNMKNEIEKYICGVQDD